MVKRIALISEHASPLAAIGGVDSGGQNIYVSQVARHLVAMGFEVDVFTRRDSESLEPVVEREDGVRVIHVDAGPARFVRKEDLLPYMAEFSANLIRFCDQTRRPYDLAHANFWMSGMAARALKKVLGIPFVITFHALGKVRRLHQGGADEFPVERFAIEEDLVAEADRILAECPQDEDDLIELYGAEPARIVRVPCGFSPDEFWPVGKAIARFAVGCRPGERILLQLGRMVPRKGVDNAIRGFASLLRRHAVDARLLIVGGGSEKPDPVVTPELGRLKRIAAQEGVLGRVSFVGGRGRDQLKYYYSAADAFITTPQYEPFGITPVEAMACGTPVVGSEVGGIKYTVRHGQTGYLVPPANPRALGERLVHLYRNPHLLESFGRQALRRARRLFTWQRVAEQIAEVYEDAAARPATAVNL